jgi:hypothetical protein
VSTCASVSETVSPLNNGLPLSISHSTTPNAQMSARLSTVFPRACSGLIQPAVPRIIPARVGEMVSLGEFAGLEGSDTCATAARPKSSTLTTPAAVIMMLAGFRSR